MTPYHLLYRHVCTKGDMESPEKRTCTYHLLYRHVCTKGDMESPESDSDSDVEWEEVELGSGEPEGAELLQEHGIPGQGFSVPIQLSNRSESQVTWLM